MSWQPPSATPSTQLRPPQLRPLGVGEIIDVTFRLYRQNFVPMVQIAFFGVIPAQALSLLILLSSVPDTTTDVFGNEFVDTDDWRLVAGSFGSTLVSGLATLIVVATITKSIAHTYVEAAPVDVGASIRETFHRLLPLIGMTVLYYLGVLVGAIPCLVGFFWLSVSWSVAAPALMLEQTGPVGALGRSFRLVRQRWWPTFGLLILVFLMRTIVTQLISTPITLASGASSGFGTFGEGPSRDLTRFFVAATLAGVIAGVLVTPFHAIVKVVLYVDLRVRHEGFDVEVLARSLDTPLPAHVTPTTGGIHGAAQPGAPPAARPAAPPAPPPPPPAAPPQWGGSAPPAPQ